MKSISTDPDHVTPRTGLPISLLLIALTLGVYWQVQYHDFVNYDDFRYVIENPHVRAGLTRGGLAWAFTNLEAGFWHPLTWLSHMLDCHLYGLNPKGHHLNNLLFHIANSLLLFLVLKRMTGALWRSWLVAALFALHPLHVESVAWVSERKDVLSTFFWMMTLWAYVLYVQNPRPLRYLAVNIFLALGLMAKTMVATLPFVLLLLDYWPLGRIRPGERGHGFPSKGAESVATTARGVPLFRLILEKIPLMILSALSVAVTFYAELGVGALSTLESAPMTTRIANALVSYVAYMGKTLWPRNLSALYLYAPELPGWQVAGSLAVLGVLSILVLMGARRWPYLPVGWFWYLGTFVPVIGLVKIGSHAMADRYTYIPLIGLFLVIVWGVPSLLSGWTRRRPLLGIFTGAVLAVLSLSTWFQVRYWRNSVALFEHAVRVTDRNFLAHKNLGFVLYLEGRPKQAEYHLRESLRINPGFASAHFHLANVLVLQGKDEEAVSHYRKALDIDPKDGQVHNNLGLALLRRGEREKALYHFSEALRLNPDDKKARQNLEIAGRIPQHPVRP
jgi:hypothetical protein